jgi:hypothetical protein
VATCSPLTDAKERDRTAESDHSADLFGLSLLLLSSGVDDVACAGLMHHTTFGIFLRLQIADFDLFFVFLGFLWHFIFHLLGLLMFGLYH